MPSPPCAPRRTVSVRLAQTAGGGSLHVLVAEDNPTNRLITRRMLEGFGCQVEVAADGQEAVQAVEAAGRRGFDLIVMDVVMPVLDGIAATRAIRSAPAGRVVPILAVSGNAYDTVRNDCAAAGATGFLPKPFTRAALLGALSDVIGRATPHR